MNDPTPRVSIPEDQTTLPPSVSADQVTLPPSSSVETATLALSLTFDPNATIATISPQPASGDARAPAGYAIERELGRGGMGVVYLARAVALDRPCALKMILSGVHSGDNELERFRTEAQAIARLQHPGIVQVFEVGVHDGRPFMALEFCPGGSLDGRVPTAKNILSGSGNPFDPTIPEEVKVWDAEKGHRMLTLKGHSSYIRSVAWSPDGKRILSGSQHSSKVWDAEVVPAARPPKQGGGEPSGLETLERGPGFP